VRLWHPKEILEKVGSPGSTWAVGILLKQHNHNMPLVLAVLLGSELLSELITLL
jgi:predicted metal-dependent enzyme (double-stranded beta helix superfamily)